MKASRSPRERLGLEIAATVPLAANGLLWVVPSQTTERMYTVNPVQGTCSCTDYGTRKVKCKHVWAVEFTVMRESKSVQKAINYDFQAVTQRALREIDEGQKRAGTPF